MAPLVGTALALILLLVVLAGLWWSWRHPVVGLGLLVAGMALHSFALMVLLKLGTPHPLVRVVQAWKEVLLAVLTVGVLVRIWQEWRTGRLGKLLLSDWVAIAFATVIAIYLLIPASVLHSDVNLTQRALGFRVAALLPLLYFLGRRVATSDEGQLATVVWLCLGTGAVVAAFGLFELWLVPTKTWIGWGINLYTGFLGFTYGGPGGLPENFFLTLGDGTLVRRMVSTYISPLGIAYTGLLLFPLGVALVERRPQRASMRWLAIGALALTLVGVMFSETRLALLVMVGESVVLMLLLRVRWLLALGAALGVATALMLLVYPSVGPVVARDLAVVAPTDVARTPPIVTAGAGHGQAAISSHDTSVEEHYKYLVLDLKVDLQHPMGIGLGGSTNRFGRLVGTGESAVLGVFGDMGVAGGLLYLLLYMSGIWNALRALRLGPPGSLQAALPLTALVGGLALLPITLTSDLWGDFSVTFLFWWAAGASATLAHRVRRVVTGPELSAHESIGAA